MTPDAISLSPSFILNCNVGARARCELSEAFLWLQVCGLAETRRRSKYESGFIQYGSSRNYYESMGDAAKPPEWLRRVGYPFRLYDAAPPDG